ncbi:hypothetical protein C8T65DRAFT_833550 [Cerioporus squamosus]|nr:hypothetical protein C8T65DRAFT_833550 [Cerioporus squamosus]
MTTMERSSTIRAPKRPVPAISDKFQARLDKLKMLEHEQQMEDLEVLKNTSRGQEDLQILQESFAAVKAEFMDLDGQSWDTPAAREMLVNWDVGVGIIVSKLSSASTIVWLRTRWAQSDCTVHRTACATGHPRTSCLLKPGGVRMRHQQRRRSLAAVVSPDASSDIIPASAREDDRIVRGRIAKIPTVVPRTVATTGRNTGLFRVPREGGPTMVTSGGDDDDGQDIDASSPLAPPGLGTPSGSLACRLQPPDPHVMSRLHQHLAKLAISGDSVSADSTASTSSSTPELTFVGGPRSGLAAPSASTARRSTIMLSNSPTLKQGTTLSESSSAGTVRAGLLCKRRTSGSTRVVVSGDVDPEDVATVLHEFFPGIQVDLVASAPPHTSSKLTTGPGHGMARQATAKPSSPRLAPSASATGRRARGWTLVSGAGAGVPMSRGSVLCAGKAVLRAGSDEDEDEDEDDGTGGAPLVRTMSCMGWNPSDF